MLESRNKDGLVFGVVDMTVTLLGVIIGLSFSCDYNIIITAVIVTGVADSFANASGIFAISNVDDKKTNYTSSIYCFISTFLTMIIILFPFFIYDVSQAIYISSFISIILLVILGYYVMPKDYKYNYLVPLRFVVIALIVSAISYVIGFVFL